MSLLFVLALLHVNLTDTIHTSGHSQDSDYLMEISQTICYIENNTFNSYVRSLATDNAFTFMAKCKYTVTLI